MVVFRDKARSIKMCPLVQELKTSDKLDTVVCVTGQASRNVRSGSVCFRCSARLLHYNYESKTDIIPRDHKYSRKNEKRSG